MRSKKARCGSTGVVRKGLREKLKFEQRFVGGEGVILVDVWGGACQAEGAVSAKALGQGRWHAPGTVAGEMDGRGEAFQPVVETCFLSSLQAEEQ